jgi:release factor glutamine methyltransferase
MTSVGDFLKSTTDTLKQAGVASARLDTIILLEDTLRRDRAYLLAHPEQELTSIHITELRKKVIQRTQHIPLAYIRGSAPFYGRTFTVNEHVLVPRPETETLIDLLKALPLSGKPRIADIGTGSGCIGITAALELPDAEVWLYDIDFLALLVAKTNAHDLRAHVHTIQADLLEGPEGAFDVIVANLPYVPTTLGVNADAQHEPTLALFAGTDGLDVYRRFWQQVAVLPQPPMYILIESLMMQHAKLAALASPAGYRLTATNHLIQQFERG